jgi:hypothetical protein
MEAKEATPTGQFHQGGQRVRTHDGQERLWRNVALAQAHAGRFEMVVTRTTSSASDLAARRCGHNQSKNGPLAAELSSPQGRRSLTPGSAIDQYLFVNERDLPECEKAHEEVEIFAAANLDVEAADTTRAFTAHDDRTRRRRDESRQE